MKESVAYDDAVDLLDADHKAVNKLFIKHASLCEDGAPTAVKRLLAQRICQDLTVHAQLEEEIFYPQVRQVIGDNALINTALQQHEQAKQAIVKIQSMSESDTGHDASVKQLGVLIDQHVTLERELIFLKASQAALDLRAMTLPLMKRQKQLKKQADSVTTKEEA